MNLYEVPSSSLGLVLIFLELFSVKIVVSLTSLNLKVAVIFFDRVSPTKADKLTYHPSAFTESLLDLFFNSKALISSHLAAELWKGWFANVWASAGSTHAR